MSTTTKPTYVCTVGIDHPKGRHERGDTFEGPEKALDWLIPQGLVVKQGSKEHKALVAELEAEKTEA